MIPLQLPQQSPPTQGKKLTQTSCHPAVTQLWSSCDPAVIQLWPSCDPDMSQLWSSCDPAGIQLWPSCDPAVIQLWPSCDPDMSQLWPSCDPAVIQLWPSCDPAVTQLWSSFDPAVIQLCCDPAVAKLWPSCVPAVTQLWFSCDPAVIQLWPSYFLPKNFSKKSWLLIYILNKVYIISNVVRHVQAYSLLNYIITRLLGKRPRKKDQPTPTLPPQPTLLSANICPVSFLSLGVFSLCVKCWSL